MSYNINVTDTAECALMKILLRFMKVKRSRWIIFVGLAVIIGLYPLLYFSAGFRAHGFLAGKPEALEQNWYYMATFYTHISFGSIAMLTGWSQFSAQLRSRYVSRHRALGKVYVTSVMLSSISGFAIAMFATGGLISVLGFGALALSWFFSNLKAYTAVLNRNFEAHENWMICNYALTFAAVTLRIWLPFSQAVLHMDFVSAYQIVAWLCWIPNLIVAALIVNRKRVRLATLA